MSLLRRLAYRLRAFARRHALDSSMSDEMRYHIECETADRVARGMAPAEARRTALRDFGGVDRHTEDARDERGFRWVDELGRDVRHGVRVLRRNPGYTIAATLTFALGIGLTTAIFSVVHGVLLQPLPYDEPGRLVAIWEHNVARGVDRNVASAASFEAWRERNRSFTDIAALVPAPVVLNGDEPDYVMGAEVSPPLFRILDVRAAIGRVLRDDDEQAVVLSDALWRRRFRADSTVVGRAIRLDDRPFTVVGVMPPTFEPVVYGWMPAQQLWIPFRVTAANRAWGRFLLVVGRLRDDVTIEAARADVQSIARALAGEQETQDGWSASVFALHQEIVGDVRRPLLVLLGAVGLLLLMAIVNVGSLTIGFIRRRRQELAVRRAIGASSGRVVRQVLVHSALLGALGCAVGLGAALLGTKTLVSMIPDDVPRGATIGVDGTVLLFAMLAAAVATLALGCAAALLAQRVGPAALSVISSGARASSRVGTASLVVAEIALGVVLAASSVLMLRTFVSLRSVDLGFDATNVVTGRVTIPTSRYGTAEQQRAFWDGWQRRIAAIPGVRAVSFATTRPFDCCAPSTTVDRPELVSPPGTVPPTVAIRYVDSAFFAALRIPVLRGSAFAAREPPTGPERIVVNRTLARLLWPDTSAVGSRLNVQLAGGLSGEVIGIVGDVHLVDARTPPRPTVYLATARHASTVRDVIVRSPFDVDEIGPALRESLRAVDPTLPLYRLTALRDAVNQSLARDRFTTAVLTIFAIVALALAAVGVYGVFAAEVTSRSKELGVRLALGARASGILALVLRRALILATIGVASGIIAGLAVGRSLGALVHGVSTTDPLSFATVSVLLLAVAGLATLIPALRAARISPLEATRAE